MPFNQQYEWNYENVALNKTENPDYTFILPPYFVNATEKYIVIRQVITRFQRQTEPFDYETKDIMMMSDLCSEVYLPMDVTGKASAGGKAAGTSDVFPAMTRKLGYICMSNDTNMKKKRYKYVWSDNCIHFLFQTIDEIPIIPSRWLIDILLYTGHRLTYELYFCIDSSKSNSPRCGELILFRIAKQKNEFCCECLE